MLSMILLAALGAVGDVPAGPPQNTPRATPRTYASPTTSASFYNGFSESYYGATDFSGGCRGCCPTDDVNLFFPCAPISPCAPFAPNAPRPICPPRVNTFACPTPVCHCPCPPPARPAPCN